MNNFPALIRAAGTLIIIALSLVHANEKLKAMKEATTFPLLKLPQDLLERIGYLLSPRDLVRFRSSHRHLRSLLTDSRNVNKYILAQLSHEHDRPSNVAMVQLLVASNLPEWAEGIRFFKSQPSSIQRDFLQHLLKEATDVETFMIRKLFEKYPNESLPLLVDYPVMTSDNFARQMQMIVKAEIVQNAHSASRLTSSILNDDAIFKTFLLYPDGDKSCLVAAASQLSSSRLLRSLLDVGFNPNCHDSFSIHPLAYALKFGFVQSAELLLKRGASLRSLYQHWSTPLIEVVLSMYNCINTQKEIISLLLRFGVDVDGTNWDGRTALYYVQDIEVAELLIRNGANVNHRGKQVSLSMAGFEPVLYQESPIDVHSHNENMEMVALLLKHGAKFQERCRTPVLAAAMIQSQVALTYFLGLQFSPNLPDDCQQELTPLHFTARASFDMSLQLLQNGAHLNVFESKGRTPLMVAAIYGTYRNIKLFLKNEAGINHTDAFGAQAIHYAINSGCLSCVRILKKYGSSMNSLLHSFPPLSTFSRRFNADFNNLTPLAVALFSVSTRPDMLDYLLRHGSKVNHVFAQGYNVFHLFAITQPDKYASQTLELLFKYFPSGFNASDDDGLKPFILAIKAFRSYRSFYAIRAFIKLGVDVNQQSRSGFPLHYAAKIGNGELGLELIKAGANVNRQSSVTGQTALHIASANGLYEFAKMLLKQGANPTLNDNAGQKPIDLIMKGNHFDLIELFYQS